MRSRSASAASCSISSLALRSLQSARFCCPTKKLVIPSTAINRTVEPMLIQWIPKKRPSAITSAPSIDSTVAMTVPDSRHRGRIAAV